MQRGGLIERFIETRQRREQGAEEAVRRRPGEAEAQREGEEAGDAEKLRREQPPAMHRKLPPGRADERRHGIEDVDRPVGEDRPGQERDVALPIEGDRADAGAAAGIAESEAASKASPRANVARPSSPISAISARPRSTLRSLQSRSRAVAPLPFIPRPANAVRA